ncbi:aldose 1-epimerase family protein [Microbacterium sp. SSW1-49]|uniref:Aldose 1-epimerase family protein n=1 Tax=Microbacterium croceum TaxID=2851645 RepID=A0ABT0FA28_9MICO|nr:DUF4432 family protein [Microbacterium croceum]MCK2034926.1 aldose 1-epimerase family protein [Microbacterium croceum]
MPQVWPEEWAVAHEDLLASAEMYASRHGRVVRVRTFGGWDVELLPDRCLDIGFALHDGTPISWVSPVRDRRPLDRPRDFDWLARFHGGLVTTCGLRGFGAPAADRGQHGDASHLPAGEVAISRTVTADLAEIAVSAVVEDARVFGPSLRLTRTVIVRSTRAGAAALELVDVVENRGPGVAEVGVLYHVNLGAPLVVPGARILVDDDALDQRATTPIDAGVFPAPEDAFQEYVVERSGFAGDAGSVSVHGEVGELRLTWSADTLPHLVQWMYPARGRWALGIEPATSSLLDADAELVALGPGETRRQELRISMSSPEGESTCRAIP